MYAVDMTTSFTYDNWCLQGEGYYAYLCMWSMHKYAYPPYIINTSLFLLIKNCIFIIAPHQHGHCLLMCWQCFVSMTTIPEKSGWGKLWRTYRNDLCNTEISQCVTAGDIKSFLDSKSVSYQSYELPSEMDITECFTEGDEKGELLLDFLTEVLDFSKTASPDLKAGVLELLRHPDCSVESEGRVIFNNNLGVIVLDQLT